MAYDPENNPYVPGDPYSYDLKWMVQEVKAAQAVGTQAANSAAAAAASAEAASDSAYNAGTYASNALVFSQNAKASAENAADSAENAADSAEEAAGVVASVTQALNAQGQQISVLEGRMDTFASLTQGSTTGDAELQDIRVAADGKVYPTAGDAVRGQVGALNAAVFFAQPDYDWSLLGNDNYPAGWYAGYYKTDGHRTTASNTLTDYCCTRTAFQCLGTSLKVIPPTGYQIRVTEYSSNSADNFVASYGFVNTPIVIDNAAGKWFRVSIGVFENHDSDTYYVDPTWLATCRAIISYSIKQFTDNALADLQNSKEPIKNATVSIFDKIGVCGASWDSGYYYVNNNHYENADLSWIANLAKKNGTDYACYARHSLYTKTWLTSPYGLAKLNSEDPCNFYVTTFGGNDSEQGANYLGTIADITGYDDPDNYPDTFYGNYGKIIEKIQAHAPKALILMIFWYNSDIHTAIRGDYYNAAQAIASHYGLPFVNWADDNWYSSDFLQNNLQGNHPTPAQLSGIADSFARLFSNAVANNIAYFNTYNP